MEENKGAESRAERIQRGKRMCSKTLAPEVRRRTESRRRTEEKVHRELHNEGEERVLYADEGEPFDVWDLPARLVVACGIFLLLLLSSRYLKVVEAASVQAWVQENEGYETLVETAAWQVRKWLPDK